MKIFIIIMLFLSSLGFASQLKVIANNFHGDEAHEFSIFTGNVKITRGVDELNASKVTIYMNKKHQPIKTIADGNVSFFVKTDNNISYRGVAQKAIYFPQKKEYQFFKHVHLWQLNNKREIHGDKIFLNLINGTAVAHGANAQPVVMIFNIRDKNKTK